MSKITRTAFMTSLKITVVYTGGWILCRHVLIKLPLGVQVVIAALYLTGAMFWVFQMMKRQLLRIAALSSELRAADESFETRVRSRTVELEEALKNNKTFQGIIPICANCKSIRNGTGDWERIESYVQRHSDAVFSHGLCPDCNEALYGDQRRRIEVLNGKKVQNIA